ncbi:MAG TPA: RteC domain-containing protein [Sphingobacterium sp.]|nr:RteC domain-containing protein [Sphingobacterium sp.]
MQHTLSALTEDIVTYTKEIEENHRNDYSAVSDLSIHYISERLQWVKEKFEKDENISPQEEIFYFKSIKCHLLALMQYYLLVKNIENKKPPIKKKKIKKYYLKELYKIKKKLRKNSFYYNYYKTMATHLDHQFFRRMEHDIYIPVGSYILNIDCRYNTPAIHLFSRLEAYDRLRKYLKGKIKNFDKKRQKQQVTENPSTLKWTDSKTGLIEIVYAFHAAGVFNNGKAEIKEIAEFFQQNLNIDLGQYNRVFYDIRTRKKSKTKFIDNLKNALTKRIKETESELFI